MPFLRPAICALTVTAVTLSCGLAARAQVGVSQGAPVAAVGVAPEDKVAGVTTAPVTGAATVTTKPAPGAAPVKAAPGAGAAAVKTTLANGAAAVGALGGIRASGVNTGLLLLLGQIADGQITMDEAWNKGLLDAPKVLQLLGQSQRLTEDERNEKLQRDMAGLLVRLAPATVATPEGLSARVRVALCRYYSSVGDARAIPLCEALIAEKLDGKQIRQPLASNPDGGSSSLWLSSVILLAQYYENTEQWQKAGETWERALVFWQDVVSFQGGVRIDAARVYAQVGNASKSDELYEQVAQFGDEWLTQFALQEQIYQSGIRGDRAQMRELLKKLGAQGDANGDKLTELSYMALGHYRKGDFDKAITVAQEAVTFRESLAAFPKAPALEDRKDIAEEVLWWSERWKKTPIPVVVDPAEMRRFVHAGDKPLIWQLSVNSFKPLTATITSDSDNVKVRTITRKPVNAGLYYSNIVELEIAATKIDTALTVHIPAYPELQLQVPIIMEIQRTEQMQQTIDTIVVD